MNIDIDYNISLFNDNVISIQYFGIADNREFAHPDKLFFTTNINLDNGDKIKLSHCTSISTDFANNFFNGKIVACEPSLSDEQFRYIKSTLSLNDLVSMLNNSDFMDYLDNAFSYFTDNSLGISIPVPFAIGGYALFEIDYDDIKDGLKIKLK